MRIDCANFSASGLRRQGNGTSGLVRWALLVAILAGPMLAIGQAAPNPQNAPVTAQSHLSTQPQTKRRQEIPRRAVENAEAQDETNIYRHSAMVHKIARSFGLPVETTSRMFEIINFVFLVALIVWGVAKVLPKSLRARTERIHREVQQARMATDDANRRLAAVEERLSRLDAEIEAVRIQAEQDTVQEEKRLRDAMEQEKQSILASANQDIRAATKNAESQLRKLAADLVIENAKRQIAISSETDRALVSGFLADVNGNRPRGGVN